MLEEIMKSSCDRVRFGTDFCEWKIPNLEVLKKAYSFVHEGGKEFIYVTPRLSNSSFKRVQEQLAFLSNNGRETKVVINDLGLISILEKYPNLKLHLGRRLVFMPARCPWIEETLFRAGFFERKKLEELYHQTSLNYAPTIHFYQKYGIKGVDVDWIPRSFLYLNFLIRNGFTVSVHIHLIPVTITRRCHTARFLSEKEPQICSRPCDKRAFLLKQPTLKKEFYLHGNTVFRFIQSSLKDVKQLHEQGIEELVVTVNPITKIDSGEKIDAFIQNLRKS